MSISNISDYVELNKQRIGTTIYDSTGLDENSQSIVLSYLSDRDVAEVVDPKVRTVFYANLANSIIENADRIDLLNCTLPWFSTDEERLRDERFIFPPLNTSKKEQFVTEVFQRMHALAKSTGVVLEESDFDLEAVLRKSKRAITIHENMESGLPYMSVILATIAFVGGLLMLGVPTSAALIASLPPGTPIPGNFELGNMGFEGVCGKTLAPICHAGANLYVLVGLPLLGYACSKSSTIRYATSIFHRFVGKFSPI